MNKTKKIVLIIILLIFLGLIAGVLCFIRSTITFPIIKTEDQAERNIRTLYFYDEEKYKDSDLEVVASCENDEFVLYSFKINEEFGYAMYEFMSLGRVDQNGVVVTTDDYMVEVMTYNEKPYLVMMRKGNIGNMIAYDKNSGAEIELESLETNGEDTISMWEFDDEPDITYDVYDNQGNLIVENKEL